MQDAEKKLEVVVIIGPTASGKSDFAVEYALSHNGEVISADSRQLYRGLDIGTGKITQEEMKGIPHHMLDVCDIGEKFSVAEYVRLALPILEDICVRGKTPIICGGTGHYVDALIYKDTFPQIPPNETLRKELEGKTTEELFEELASCDPDRAKTIDKHNRVRLVRALEIIKTIGKVPELPVATLRYPVEIHMLAPTKELLIERIATRLEKRLAYGMLEEGRALRARHFSDSYIASLGLEYKWMNTYLTDGCTYEEMKAHILTESWRYAKRQITWNKKYKDIATIITLP